MIVIVDQLQIAIVAEIVTNVTVDHPCPIATADQLLIVTGIAATTVDVIAATASRPVERTHGKRLAFARRFSLGDQSRSRHGLRWSDWDFRNSHRPSRFLDSNEIACRYYS